MLKSIREIVLSEEIIRKERQKIKHIRTTKVYERYQADTVKLSQDLNMNGNISIFLL